MGVGDAGSDPQLLSNGVLGFAGGPLVPYISDTSRSDAGSVVYSLALAPPGCDIARSRPGFGGNATWESLGDQVFRIGRNDADWWRVACNGVVRYQTLPRAPGPASPDTTGPADRQDPEQIAWAKAGWRQAAGLPAGQPTLRWSGQVPGTSTPAVVVTAAIRAVGP